MKRTENALESKQVLSVIEKYNTALELLDSYDHQTMVRPKDTETAYVLTYEECREVIESMRFGDGSSLFGREKDDSFKITASPTEISALPRPCFYIFWTKSVYYLWTVRN